MRSRGLDLRRRLTAPSRTDLGQARVCCLVELAAGFVAQLDHAMCARFGLNLVRNQPSQRFAPLHEERRHRVARSWPAARNLKRSCELRRDLQVTGRLEERFSTPLECFAVAFLVLALYDGGAALLGAYRGRKRVGAQSGSCCWLLTPSS